uniref:Uncharacterized protein n=1 Tax=Arundo donax TaxID=35708 RepID=A0A0A9BA38_ARUDO
MALPTLGLAQRGDLVDSSAYEGDESVVVLVPYLADWSQRKAERRPQCGETERHMAHSTGVNLGGGGRLGGGEEVGAGQWPGQPSEQR